MRIKMPVAMQRWAWAHIVLDRDVQSPLPRNGTAIPHLSARVYCGQTVAHLSNCWVLGLMLHTAVVNKGA